MRKKFLAALVVAVGIAFAGYSMLQTKSDKNTLSDLLMANVEALANGESGGSSDNWDCWSQEKSGSGYWRCGNPCKFVDGYGGKGNSSKCYK